MNEASLVEILIQGGAVAIALAALWIIYRLVSNHDKHLRDVVDRNTDAWVKTADALARLCEKLKK